MPEYLSAGYLKDFISNDLIQKFESAYSYTAIKKDITKAIFITDSLKSKKLLTDKDESHNDRITKAALNRLVSEGLIDLVGEDYILSFEGYVVLNNGGYSYFYESSRKEEKRQILNVQILQFAAAATICWFLLEVLKFVLPMVSVWYRECCK